MLAWYIIVSMTMIISTGNRLPKYLYTPDNQRAYLTISADVYGLWSAGYTVWGDHLESGGQETFMYGPSVNECADIDQATVQLFNCYLLWKEEQDGLLGS